MSSGLKTFFLGCAFLALLLQAPIAAIAGMQLSPIIANIPAVFLMGVLPAFAFAVTLALLFLDTSNYYSYLACFVVPLLFATLSRITVQGYAQTSIRVRLIPVAYGLVTLTMALQALRILPSMNLPTYAKPEYLESGRALGFFLEPSFAAPALFCYILYCYTIRPRDNLSKRDIAFVVISVVATRSISVFLVSLYVVLRLLKPSKKALLSSIIMLGLVTIVAIPIVLRLFDSVYNLSGGNILSLLTTGLSSWRNVPEIAFLSDFINWFIPKYNLTREAIQESILMVPELYQYSYVDSVFTLFASFIVVVGLPLTIAFIVFILVRFRRHLSFANLYLGIVILAVLPKVYFLPWIFFINSIQTQSRLPSIPARFAL